MRLSLFAACAALALSGCVEEPELDTPPDMTESCGAGGLQDLIGRPKSVLSTMRFSQPIRIISPGMAVTMDFAPHRLNIDLDARGMIIRVYCG